VEESEVVNHPGFPLYATILQRQYDNIHQAPRFADNFSHYILNLLGDTSVSEGVRVDEFLTILKMYDAIKEDVKKMRKDIGISEITKSAYEFIDVKLKEQLDSQSKIKPSCKSGCSYCCHLNVGIGLDEAKNLAKHLDDTMIVHLKKQRDVLIGLGKGGYESFPHVTDWNTSACVFLKDSKCSVYSDRPMACRMYFVASEPKLCDPVENKDGKTAQLITTEAEILRGVMSHYYHNKPMPIYLLQEIGE
jgi:Fe-S-cluster containining protein